MRSNAGALEREEQKDIRSNAGALEREENAGALEREKPSDENVFYVNFL